MRNAFAARNIAAIVFIGALVAACSGGPQQTQAPTPSPQVGTPEPVQPTTAATGAAGGTEVSIANFAFDPATIQVQVGDTVTWTNEDSAAHTVTFADDGPDSGSLSQGQTFEHTFDAAGEFDYICEIHPTMQGKVSVSP